MTNNITKYELCELLSDYVSKIVEIIESEQSQHKKKNWYNTMQGASHLLSFLKINLDLPMEIKIETEFEGEGETIKTDIEI